MKNPLKALLVILSVGLVAMASERVNPDSLTVKSLPVEVYAKLEKGKKLSRIWKDASFSAARGYKVPELDWKAENRVGEVSSYLKENLPTMGTKDGYYSLDLIVTEAVQGTIGYFGNKTGYFILEGQVKDADGHVVAAFVTKEEDEFGNMAKTLKPGVDRAISGIVSELFKK